ncbi:MAG: hypothetical protein WCC92_02340 [Candidatus Korobacteraceae bacterium]
MKPLPYPLMLAIAISIPAMAQEPASTPQNTPPSSNTPVEQQTNAASASKDNSRISGDEVTKPAVTKGTNLIGCLEGPDQDGKYTLRSMAHRTGVEVLGPYDLLSDSGSKVKLTGSWQASPQQPSHATANAKGARHFQATAVEVLSQHCVVPSEKTPVSQEKQRQREQQQLQNKSSAGDQTSPKQ